MHTAATELLGVEHPIFAFSHSPQVVAAVTRAGGVGVFGAAQREPEELERILAWLDSELGDLPYGVDLLIPHDAPDDGLGRDDLIATIPEDHRAFVSGLLDEYDVPPLSEEHAPGGRLSDGPIPVVGNALYNYRDALPLVEITLASRAKLFANALGTPPADVVEGAHERGLLVAALAGRPEHAVKHRDAGVDIVIAQGYEAGGHTGDVGSLVLIPDVVDAVAPLPVLAAGGIADGRQFAAALILGACGVWTGSIWLTTEEAETHPVMKERFLRARTGDTLRSRSTTGRTARQLKSRWTEAWDDPGNPDPLPMPLQGLLTAEAIVRISHAAREGSGRADELLTYYVGQVVGRLREVRPTAEVLRELAESCERAIGADGPLSAIRR